jgi:signal peptidase II
MNVLLAVAIAVVALDIASKAIVVATLSGSAPIRLLGGLLTLREARNPGAAFNLGGPSETIVFTAIAAGVVIFIIRASRRINSVAWAVALGLLLGGATGNLIDRVFRSPGLFRGWVVDWIELPHWPVFNLADSAITCGGVLMVLLAVFGHGIEGRVRAAGVPPAQPQHPVPEGTRAVEPMGAGAEGSEGAGAEGSEGAGAEGSGGARSEEPGGVGAEGSGGARPERQPQRGNPTGHG